MVNRRADAEFVFDVDLALSQSDENPVYYLQYAHARICSVFAQAQEKGVSVPSVEEIASEDLSSLTAPTELRLMSKLSDFPTALANGADDLSPLALVTYLKELAADFHSFYNAERVLVDDEKLRNARWPFWSPLDKFCATDWKSWASLPRKIVSCRSAG